MDVKLLGIYLNDHLSGSVLGVELARRAARVNRGTPLGDFLSTFVKELEEDQKVVEQLLRTLKVPRNALKQTLGWVFEKLGRLKLNGHLTGYSPLSRLVELEGLCVGTQGRGSMWRVLKQLSRSERHLAGFDFEALLTRAEAQLKALERWRLQAADTAFSSTRLVPGTLSPAGGNRA
jgi:hypothetical protein